MPCRKWVAVLALRRGERLAGLAGADAHATGVLPSETELRRVDRRQRDRHEVASLFADHFAALDVLGKVRLDLAAHDLAEALMVSLYLLSHEHTTFTSAS